MARNSGHIIFDCDGTLISRGPNGYTLFPEIKELLLKLKSLNFSLYVWTARDRVSTLAILKDLGIIQLFEDFRCVDDTIPKPHPMGPEELAGEHPREEIMIIGDSRGDIQGAKNFGCQSIAALWEPTASRASLEAEGADHMAMAPMDCLKIIKERFSHV